MKADLTLYEAAVELIERRWPDADWATAAAVYLDDGSIATGVTLDNFNSAASLCAETGPLCQAYTTNRIVVASICVNRARGRTTDLVLAPCGVCRERLALWGPEVEVGVVDSASGLGWTSRPLRELNPYYWATAFSHSSAWPSPAEHAG